MRHSSGNPEGSGELRGVLGALQTAVTHGEIRGQACVPPPPRPAGGDGCFLRAASGEGGLPEARTSAGPGGWGLEGGAGRWPGGRTSPSTAVPRQCLGAGDARAPSHHWKGPPRCLELGGFHVSMTALKFCFLFWFVFRVWLSVGSFDSDRICHEKWLTQHGEGGVWSLRRERPGLI